MAGGKVHPPNELASCDPYQSDLYNKKEIPLGDEERGQTRKPPNQRESFDTLPPGDLRESIYSHI